MWTIIALLCMVSLFFPPMWVVTGILAFLTLQKDANKLSEDTNKLLEQEFGDDFNPEVASKPNHIIVLVLVCGVVSIVLLAFLVGSFAPLPK